MQLPDYTGFRYFNITSPHEYVAQVEIDRSKKLNAFIEPMWRELGAIFDQISTDPAIRAVVLTGAGDKAFTSGLDLQAATASDGGLAQSSKQTDGEEEDDDAARTAVRLRRHILAFQADISSIERCEKPVIAALHGVAFGLAVDICLACDIRLSAADARFSVREVDVGLAADIGTLSRLPAAGVPMGWAKDVCLSAREFGAEEALRVGFVSAVYENKAATLDKALEMARSIAAKSPVAVQATKDVLNFSRDHSVQDGLNYVANVNMAMLQTRDVKNAMLAGIQKRKPKFSKL